MLVPSTPYVPQASGQGDETKDFITAIRLLAGKDCLRDTSQAQMMLVRLSESSNAAIAEDAAKILRTALKRGWLEQTVPKYFELENMAEKALSQPSMAAQEVKTAIVAALGVAVLLVGVAVFLYARGPGENIIFALLVGLAILAIAVKFAIKRRN